MACFFNHKWKNTGREFEKQMPDFFSGAKPRPLKTIGYLFEQECKKCGKRRTYEVSV